MHKKTTIDYDYFHGGRKSSVSLYGFMVFQPEITGQGHFSIGVGGGNLLNKFVKNSVAVTPNW